MPGYVTSYKDCNDDKDCKECNDDNPSKLHLGVIIFKLLLWKFKFM